jgi:hypothetical protein
MAAFNRSLYRFQVQPQKTFAALSPVSALVGLRMGIVLQNR